MGKLNIERIDKNIGSFEVPSSKGKHANVSYLVEGSSKKYFIVNNNYQTKDYLKKKVGRLISEELNEQMLDISISAFRTGNEIYTDHTNAYSTGEIVILKPDFNNYLSAGIVECSAYTIRQPIKTKFKHNKQTSCKGGGLKNYSIFTVL